MRLKDLATRSTDLFHFDPTIIEKLPGFNVRLPGPGLDAHIAELAVSIAEVGVQTPVTVRLHDGKVFLTDGHCRLDAALLAIKNGADIKSIPCVPELKGASEAQQTLSLLTRNGGRPLEQVEKAEVIRRLIGFGWAEEEIGRKVGIGEKQVRNLLELSEAPAAIKTMIAQGEVSATTAIKVMKAEGATAATATLTQAVVQAKSEGKTKVTPKAVAAARPETASAPLRVSTAKVSTSVPTPATATPATTSRYSAEKVKEFVETFKEMLNVSDIKTIHTMVRDVLK